MRRDVESGVYLAIEEKGAASESICEGILRRFGAASELKEAA
jgi:hypothetical protein